MGSAAVATPASAVGRYPGRYPGAYAGRLSRLTASGLLGQHVVDEPRQGADAGRAEDAGGDPALPVQDQRARRRGGLALQGEHRLATAPAVAEGRVGHAVRLEE